MEWFSWILLGLHDNRLAIFDDLIN